MILKRLIPVILAIFGASLPTPRAHAAPASGESTIEDRWDAIAREHVRPGRIGAVDLNVVDYAAISRDSRWPELLRQLETAAEPPGRAEKLAFWINAYNIMAIKMVLTKYPVDSIKDAGGWVKQVWDIDVGVVAGKTRTLTEIEHQILRPMDEPRIHAAIVCASVSCPPLRAEAFRAGSLEAQLDDQMRVWLANEATGIRVEGNGATLRISPIFKWFAEDFEKDAGSVRAFIERHMPEAARTRAKSDARLAYLDYDWSLNDAKRSALPR